MALQDTWHTEVLATRRKRERKKPPAPGQEVARLERLARELDTATEDATGVATKLDRDIADELFIQHRMVRSPKFEN